MKTYIKFLSKIYENKKMISKFFIPLIISILVITPTLLNNYSKFDEIILTKSFGYNLWRGNSEKLNINGSNFAMDNKFINDWNFRNNCNSIVRRNAKKI